MEHLLRGLGRGDISSIDSASFRVRYKQNVLISFAVLLTAIGLAYRPGLGDLPLARLVNSFANRSPALDGLFYDFDDYFTFSGVILVALIWSCWFKSRDLEIRARLLVATLISIGAGGVSRLLQHWLPTHPRPYYDPALGFHSPSTLPGTPYNTWNSFPSDHAAMFSGLVVGIYLVRPRSGLLVAAWLVLVESARIYMGAHYPSDLMGGAALAATFVWASQSPSLISAGRQVARWERSSPSMFYMCAFFISYQVATLFADIRGVAGAMVGGPR
jgi:membrane-associated phospholipid phosphatase